MLTMRLDGQSLLSSDVTSARYVVGSATAGTPALACVTKPVPAMIASSENQKSAPRLGPDLASFNPKPEVKGGENSGPRPSRRFNTHHADRVRVAQTLPRLKRRKRRGPQHSPTRSPSLASEFRFEV